MDLIKLLSGMCIENIIFYISFMDMNSNFTSKWHFINRELFIQCAFSVFVCLFLILKCFGFVFIFLLKLHVSCTSVHLQVVYFQNKF